MGQNGNVAGEDEVEKELCDTYWRNVMRGLDKHVGRARQRQKMPAPQTLCKVRYHVIIGAAEQFERYPGFVEPGLHQGDCGPDAGARIMINPRNYVRCAGDVSDALADISASHG